MTERPVTPPIRTYERRLLELQRRLTEDAEQVERETLERPDDPNESFEDQGEEASLQEVDLQLVEQEDALLEQVVDALRRIEAGTFGLCERCARPIDSARLDVLPYARYCAACQQLVEAQA